MNIKETNTRDWLDEDTSSRSLITTSLRDGWGTISIYDGHNTSIIEFYFSSDYGTSNEEALDLFIKAYNQSLKKINLLIKVLSEFRTRYIKNNKKHINKARKEQ